MPPVMLMDALWGVRRRVKLLAVGFGFGVAAAVVVGLLLGVVLLDYVFNLPAVPRVALSLAAVAAVGYVVLRWILKPAAARLSLADVASHLERAFPQFDDRLRSTVDFASGRPIYGSDVMQQRVMSEAAQLATQLNLNQAVVVRPVWYSAASGTAAIALALILSLFV